jgi:cytochrome P450
MARAIEILSKHPDVQQRLQEELMDAFSGSNDWSYNKLMSLPFLDAVVKEVYRFYPPAYFFLRTAREDTVLPLSFPVVGTDGQVISEVPVRKNQNVIMGLGGTNMDERIWGPDAAQWNPERFLRPLPESVIQAKVPGIYSHT